MSGFFDRMAARARGHEPRVTLRRRSRFECSDTATGIDWLSPAVAETSTAGPGPGGPARPAPAGERVPRVEPPPPPVDRPGPGPPDPAVDPRRTADEVPAPAGPAAGQAADRAGSPPPAAPAPAVVGEAAAVALPPARPGPRRPVPRSPAPRVAADGPDGSPGDPTPAENTTGAAAGLSDEGDDHRPQAGPARAVGTPPAAEPEPPLSAVGSPGGPPWREPGDAADLVVARPAVTPPAGTGRAVPAAPAAPAGLAPVPGDTPAAGAVARPARRTWHGPADLGGGAGAAPAGPGGPPARRDPPAANGAPAAGAVRDDTVPDLLDLVRDHVVPALRERGVVAAGERVDVRAAHQPGTSPPPPGRVQVVTDHRRVTPVAPALPPDAGAGATAAGGAPDGAESHRQAYGDGRAARRDVHVHIDRVEVIRSAPAVPPTPPATPRADLDRYLARRREDPSR
ncbi:hypothetical protein ACIBTZ_24455 [Micromonospora sp. NPDC049460]|uniref:hypothetical protein n=1 Tax=Micromonospora sp. NPDC049460 TaxID=3364272 RepID=UPI0037B8F32B